MMTDKHDFSNMFLNAEIKPIPNLQIGLKSCPFCGTPVLFEKDAFYNIYQGICEGCTMQFRYEEKEEEITHDFMSGEIRVTHIMPRKRRLNLPFEQVWNTRSSMKETRRNDN